MKQAADRPEVAAIKRFISARSENIFFLIPFTGTKEQTDLL